MKCEHGKCVNKGRKETWGLCNPHYEVARRKREAEGGRKIGRVPADQVIEHVEKLRNAGLGFRQVAKLAGVTPQTIQQVGKHPTSFTDIAHKILSVPMPNLVRDSADGQFIPVLGTTRRLRALNAIGWPNGVIAGRLGVTETTLSRWVKVTSPLIRASMARRVDVLFRELQLTPAPDSTGSRRARLRAERNGWPVPMAWDPQTIDLPSSLPDLGGKSDFMDTVADFRGMGKGDAYAAEFLGIELDSLRRRVEREIAKVV